MHRHAYQGRKLSREAGPRQALVRGQLTSLVLYEHIDTTLAKAKEVAPALDRLVTIAKRDTLADRRKVRTSMQAELAYQKLMRELLPALADRTSGYTNLVKLPNRRGDNAPMARLSLILAKPAKKTDDEATAVKDETPKTEAKAVKTPAKKPTSKKTAKATK